MPGMWVKGCILPGISQPWRKHERLLPKDTIPFHYRCFDRVLLNATIQPFQRPERVMSFWGSYGQFYP
jgi:hypothetical protein